MGEPSAQPQLGWHGIAHLTYAVWEETCVPIQTFTQAPLKVQRPLYPEGKGVCHTVLVHTAGGMVRGDSLDVQLKLAPDCRVVATTAAANKVYGSQSAALHAAGLTAAQTVGLALPAGSCLEWFPQETIVFNEAQYRQDLRVDLAPGALWCGWDITRFGRSARGERFERGHWRSHLEVWQGERPLWIDRQVLEGGSPALDSPNGLRGYAVVGSFVVLGKMPDPDQVTRLRNLWPLDQPGDTGVTRLQNGLLCRYRGPSSQTARQWFVAVWQHLRPWYLDLPVVVPRVWQR
ncbi:MAG: urease accessory protein UreD [Nodosilinea sp.]